MKKGDKGATDGGKSLGRPHHSWFVQQLAQTEALQALLFRDGFRDAAIKNLEELLPMQAIHSDHNNPTQVNLGKP